MSVDYPSQRLGECHDYVEIGQGIGRKTTADRCGRISVTQEAILRFYVQVSPVIRDASVYRISSVKTMGRPGQRIRGRMVKIESIDSNSKLVQMLMSTGVKGASKSNDDPTSHLDVQELP